MKNYILPIVLVGMLVAGCSKPETIEEIKEKTLSLEGSWSLVASIDHPNGGTEWIQHPDSIIYQKHITPTHFTWFSYDPNVDRLLGAGGGTYTYSDGVYTEDIEFFSPVGSGLLGTTIPFDVAFDDNDLWLHTGYAKVMEFDPEEAEMVVIDTNKIEEKWERIGGVGEHSEMAKTWYLKGYRESPSDSTFSEYPPFVGYVKLLTNTHFTWVRYNSEENNGDVVGLGSGTWTLNDDTYQENILVMHPSGSGALLSSIPFRISFDQETKDWLHYGYVVNYAFDEYATKQPTDSIYIDEVWSPASDQ